ncbi:nitroreductase family deazaflavin-dependent oxidoreductase [Phytohabitans houttuyneae]|uniref:Nitroreductase n=1 Tax=Phytohabitans houttuyneae TaxID=1076126 RepID=A0A6V8KDH3_9ACTN|nr:nitroreductase family deazaflavin-dependent oxidoreductase [Phytohabitans houttuyneae]GFJ81490.1 nitroreductase [Phytohabitans houttuyneae]
MADKVVDSSVGWVARHINSYVDTDGKSGHRFHGVEALLLTTRGRRSGALRRTALYYGTWDGDYVLVASNGGSVGHPLWYRNLVADPRVTVQVKDDVFDAVARTAAGEERAALWDRMVGICPKYAQYQAMVQREIPVVVLTRSA